MLQSVEMVAQWHVYEALTTSFTLVMCDRNVAHHFYWKLPLSLFPDVQLLLLLLTQLLFGCCSCFLFIFSTAGLDAKSQIPRKAAKLLYLGCQSTRLRVTSLFIFFPSGPSVLVKDWNTRPSNLPLCATASIMSCL
jgi:hypothetical protein